jgi:hypothetical protein
MTVLDLTHEQYHADQTGGPPTLSCSIAKLLVSKTPLHAWAAHPRLNPAWEPDGDPEKFDLGTAIHSLFLQGIDLVHLVPADSWRKKEHREERDDARARGKIPMLEKQWDDVARMLDALRLQVAKLPIKPPPFTGGAPEQTIVWDEDCVKCRARLDWLHDGALTIDDLKTTSASAEPDAWRKTMYGMGADIQAAFYVRGVQAVYGVTFCDFRWIVAETYPPYALSVIDLAPSALALANEKVEHALAVWKRCLERDEWPGYPARVASVDAPGWEEARWMERQAMAQEAAA